MLAVLDESHRYVAVVVDREHAWLYEFFMGELEEAGDATDRALRKRDYAGWHGLEERRVRNKAEELARRHFRETSERVEQLVQATSAELLIVGGHHDEVANFLVYLPHELQSRVAGTFTIDTHTVTPARVCERGEEIVNAYEQMGNGGWSGRRWSGWRPTDLARGVWSGASTRSTSRRCSCSSSTTTRRFPVGPATTADGWASQARTARCADPRPAKLPM
jgi:hypothetical protein